jgi:hypothetical protein
MVCFEVSLRGHPALSIVYCQLFQKFFKNTVVQIILILNLMQKTRGIRLHIRSDLGQQIETVIRSFPFILPLTEN